jgi:hypothetical protein
VTRTTVATSRYSRYLLCFCLYFFHIFAGVCGVIHVSHVINILAAALHAFYTYIVIDRIKWHLCSYTKGLFELFHLFLDICCKRFDLDVAYVFTHMLQQCVSKCFIYFSLLLQQVFSCCKLQVLYLDVAYVFTHMLQSVYSRCFVCFRHMLHSSVSCCMCFLLFGDSGGAGE